MANIKVKAIDSFHLNGVGQIHAKQIISLPEAQVKELVKAKLVLVAKSSKVIEAVTTAKKAVAKSPENKMLKAAGENKKAPAAKKGKKA